MNKERILELADLIEKQPHTTVDAPNGFTMSNWRHVCGTPACIAGWAAHMCGQSVSETAVDEIAAEYLEITDADARSLFMSDCSWVDEDEDEDEDVDEWDEITPQHAARVLRRFAETGEVDWEGTR